MYQVAIGWRWGIDSPLVRPPRWIWADCNGGENDEKQMGEYDIKQWEKNGKGGENDEKNNGKKEGLWHKTMEKMGKQWKIWVERLENWLKHEAKRWKE